MSEIVSVRNLCVSYDGKDVISGVSFDVNDGEVLAVIGPNGSGKTTLIKAILGLLPAREGGVTLFGREASGKRLRPVAYIPQRMELDRTFPITLGEMLGLRKPAKSAGAERYIEMLALGGLLKKRIGELSGGQMQRALLAYAIINEPGLLVMDEPTSWVDIKGADCILCIMEEFKKKGIAMIAVSHDFSMIRAVATDVLGLGREGYFFGRADSPSLDEKIESLFATSHHGAAMCVLPERKNK